jgi:hypothetical protein
MTVVCLRHRPQSFGTKSFITTLIEKCKIMSLKLLNLELALTSDDVIIVVRMNYDLSSLLCNLKQQFLMSNANQPNVKSKAP